MTFLLVSFAVLGLLMCQVAVEIRRDYEVPASQPVILADLEFAVGEMPVEMDWEMDWDLDSLSDGSNQ